MLITLKSPFLKQPEASTHAMDIKTQGENGISIKWAAVDPEAFTNRILLKINDHVLTCPDNSSNSMDIVKAF